MGNNTNLGLFFVISVAAALDFRALGRTFPDAPNSEPLVLLMMEGRSCADVATLQRYCLLTFTMVDPTSRRWDITTWGRRDVGTSRRSSTFMHCFLLLQFASKVCSFHFLFTCIHRNCHTQVSGYTMSVLGTHHTPKLNFLLVPKQE